MRSGKLSRRPADQASAHLLRGEIWINPEVLAEAGFDRGPRGIIDFAMSLEADICFFHWPESVLSADLRELAEYAHHAGLDCGLTIDGPFQRLTAQRDVLDILRELARDPSGFRSLLAREMEEITEILSLVEDSGIELLLIGDDLGYAGGLYFSPAVFRSSLLPLYEALVKRTSVSGLALGWHSDGDVEPLLQDLVACGFHFFSLEPECVNLLDFKQAYGTRVSLVSGIRVAWLTAKELDGGQLAECRKEISALAGEGGLILASSCGIYSPRFIPNLRQIYRLIDGMAPLSS